MADDERGEPAAATGRETTPTVRERILTVIRDIPEGRVMTYGGVALAAGVPGAARLVGNVLYGLREVEEDVPWQRVVNAAGRLSTWRVGAGELQRELLRAEGVDVSDDGRLELRRYLFDD